ncbi:MAG: serine hydrolase domain-containing protein [Oligosphaeraceae bacterium]
MNEIFQERLEEILRRHTAPDGDELGVQCCVGQGGVLQAEAYGGSRNREATLPVEEETLFPVFSTGKTLFSTLGIHMVEKLGLSLEMAVGEVWPAFRQGKKGKITLRHLLTHTSGMHIMPPVSSPEELTDWEAMCERIAAREPVWEPGTQTQYQALSYAWLLGGTLERLTHRSLPELMRAEILEPAGVENDVFFGLPESQEGRLGEVEPAPDLKACLPQKQTFLDPLYHAMEEPSVRRACLPSFNCLANARGLLAFGNALLQGQFFSPEWLRQATTLQRPPQEPIPSENPDVYWSIFGLGYILLAPPPWRGRLFGHHGFGGSELSLDQKTGTAFAIVKNRLSCKVNQPMKMEIHRLAAELLGSL